MKVIKKISVISYNNSNNKNGYVRILVSRLNVLIEIHTQLVARIVAYIGVGAS
jgi:hypothetical protein